MKRFKLFTAMTFAFILSLTLAVTVAAAQGEDTNPGPTGLTAELCRDSVCLSWTPGSAEATSVRVLHWRGSSIYNTYEEEARSIGVAGSSVKIRLASLAIEPSEVEGSKVMQSFQIVEIEETSDGALSKKYSNHVTLELPRPVIGPVVRRDNPSFLSATLYEEAIYLSWVLGSGDYTYQEVIFWKTDDPSDIYYRGGWITNVKTMDMEVFLSTMNHDTRVEGDVSYTFQVSAVTRKMGRYEYVGDSNTATVVVPAHLMHAVGSYFN